MSSNIKWEDLHNSQNWGIFPCEHLVREVSKYSKMANKKLTILEIGCGAGSNIALYDEYCQEMIGIDLSKSAISNCENHSKIYKRCQFKFICDDIKKFNFKKLNKFFDIIVDIECLYCLNNIEAKKVIDQSSNLLKKDGHFFSLIFNEETSLSLLRKVEGLSLRNENDILNMFKSFDKLNIEKSTRTYNQQRKLISEYIVKAERFKIKK